MIYRRQVGFLVLDYKIRAYVCPDREFTRNIGCFIPGIYGPSLLYISSSSVDNIHETGYTTKATAQKLL